MLAFASSEELSTLMVQLWEAIRNDPGMSAKILDSKLIVRFQYREPASTITIDCSDGYSFNIYAGECDKKPIVEMAMTADLAHEFWNGKVSVPLNILTGKIIARGPVNKALALLPVIKPAFEIYPALYAARNTKAAVS